MGNKTDKKASSPQTGKQKSDLAMTETLKRIKLPVQRILTAYEAGEGVSGAYSDESMFAPEAFEKQGKDGRAFRHFDTAIDFIENEIINWIERHEVNGKRIKYLPINEKIKARSRKSNEFIVDIILTHGKPILPSSWPDAVKDAALLVSILCPLLRRRWNAKKYELVATGMYQLGKQFVEAILLDHNIAIKKGNKTWKIERSNVRKSTDTKNKEREPVMALVQKTFKTIVKSYKDKGTPKTRYFYCLKTYKSLHDEKKFPKPTSMSEDNKMSPWTLEGKLKKGLSLSSIRRYTKDLDF